MGMKWYQPIFIVALVVMTGCAAIQTGKDVLKNKGAEISQEGLSNAEFVLCKLAPVGSVIARYGQTSERAQEYKTFCDTGSNDVNIVAPE